MFYKSTVLFNIDTIKNKKGKISFSISIFYPFYFCLNLFFYTYLLVIPILKLLHTRFIRAFRLFIDIT